MKNIKALTKSEVSGYIVSPAAYVFIIIFLLLSGFFTFSFSQFFKAGEASLQGFFLWHPWLYLFLVPAAGMHLWSDERRQGTIELLFTMPVTTAECIISKFIAAWGFIGIALIATFPILITVEYLGDPDWGAIISGYIGSFLLAGSYLAISCFTSAITRSQVVSFIVSMVICLFLILAGYPPVTDMFVNWANSGVVEFISSFSVMTHFMSIQRGVIDLQDISYYFSVIVFFLFSTGLVLKNNRQ